MLKLSSKKRIILQPKNEKKQNSNRKTKLNKAKNINKTKQQNF
jgi:hypothetical protein